MPQHLFRSDTIVSAQRALVGTTAAGCSVVTPDRYGIVATVKRTGQTAGTQHAAHRFVYETLVGPIDDGCELHHKCETKGCCNPDHLTMLTPREHKAEHARLRNPNLKLRVGGKKRVLPRFEMDPATRKYRRVS